MYVSPFTVEAFISLATNDSYSLGALVLAQSLRNAGTVKKLVLLITRDVSMDMRYEYCWLLEFYFRGPGISVPLYVIAVNVATLILQWWMFTLSISASRHCVSLYMAANLYDSVFHFLNQARFGSFLFRWKYFTRL